MALAVVEDGVRYLALALDRRSASCTPSPSRSKLHDTDGRTSINNNIGIGLGPPAADPPTVGPAMLGTVEVELGNEEKEVGLVRVVVL